MPSLAEEVARLRREVAQIKKGQRLAHGASIEDAAIEVRDGTGGLRAIVGQQGDGTTAVNIVNGAPPPVPATPTAGPALGGIAAAWDGTFADGAVIPLDWARVEVHTDPAADFTPSPETLQATIETPQGGIIYIPATGPLYVRLLARNTSGTASAPTTAAGPYAPRPVAGDIGIGEITETLIADGAITTPKVYANAITTALLAAGSVDATALKADAITGKTITGGTITGSVMRTAASGQRVAINESGSNSVKVYDATREIASMDAAGLKLTGTGGGTLTLDPNSAYPNLRLSSTDGTNSALVNVVANTPGSANLGLFSGTFTGSGFTDMRWRTFFGEDFWAAERLRNSSSSTYVGGRIYLNDTTASFGYADATGTTQPADVVMTPGLAKTRAKVTIQPNVGDANTVLFIQPGPSHTGYVMRYWDPDAGRYRFTMDKAGNVDVNGMLTAGNIASGHSTITPSAVNTPTSITVTGFSLAGSTFRAVATANTSAPGTNVTGVGCTNVTATSMTLWLTRTNIVATGIDWIVMSA
ncbi:hypothetical protein [Streptomyces sp. NRRL F-5135]|uniref:hypothetical protein n=1 Tax=Streptomyces sp. NRRL F-5135 TaxID=1463858 RepID=UPI0004CACC06|nr:hypothetical protein [Streptomyces sp. NRRL F-5135]